MKSSEVGRLGVAGPNESASKLCVCSFTDVVHMKKFGTIELTYKSEHLSENRPCFLHEIFKN